jgi:hypothetical protein
MNEKDFATRMLESPYLIGPVDYELGDPGRNQKTLEQLMAQPDLTQLESFKGIPIYETGQQIFAVDEDTRRIAYLVTYEFKYLRKLNVRGISQIKLWRSAAPRGLTAHVFWNVLLPLTGVMISDNVQTNSGQKFWTDSITEALLRGAFVYLVNTVDGTIHPILDRNDYEATGDKAYPGTNEGTAWRYLISEKPLPAGKVAT